MSDYIDLVLCETNNGKRELFQAPRFSRLSKGEMVIAECEEGDVMTNVLASMSINLEADTDETDFLKTALGFEVEELGKIKSRVVFRAMDYKED